MRHSVYKSRALLVVLWLVLGSMTVFAQELSVTTRSDAHLRSEPNRNSDSLAIVPMNTTLPIISRNEDGTWLQLNFNGTIGWIATRLLDLNGSLDAIPVVGANAAPPVVEPPQPLPVSVGGPVSAMNPRALAVRAAPNNSAAQLGELPADTIFGLNGRWGSGNRMWVRLDFNGQRGWVAVRGLTITGDINTLLDVEAAQNAVLGVCNGGAAPEVAVYDGLPGIHPVLVLNSTGQKHTWNRQMGRLGVGNTLGAAQLVACVDEEQQVTVESCRYFIGPNIIRSIYQINVRLLVAQTGQPITSVTLTGSYPRECRNREPINLSHLNGSHVALDQLREWLQPFVNPA